MRKIQKIQAKKYNVNETFLNNILEKLFPICRSIMGNGYEISLNILNEYFNFKFYKFKTGKKIFDWTIPKEWEIKDAYILNPKKKKYVILRKTIFT